jgi:hypothetical protein
MAIHLERQAAALAIRMRAAIHAIVQAGRAFCREMLELYLAMERSIGRFFAEIVQLIWLLRLILIATLVVVAVFAGAGYLRWGRTGAVASGIAGLVLVAVIMFYADADTTEVDREMQKHENFKNAVTRLFRYLFRALGVVTTVFAAIYFVFGIDTAKAAVLRHLYDSVTIQNNCDARANVAVLYQDPFDGWHVRGTWEIPPHSQEQLPIFSHGPTLGIHVRYADGMTAQPGTSGLAIEPAAAHVNYATRTIALPGDKRFAFGVSAKDESTTSPQKGETFALYVTGRSRADLRYMGYCEKEAKPVVSASKAPPKKKEAAR